MGDQLPLIPKKIELNNVSIQKICCGLYNSFSLSKHRVIYAFENLDNSLNKDGFKKMKIKPKQLLHMKKFIDIKSRWNSKSAVALSFDNIYHAGMYIQEQKYTFVPSNIFKSFFETYSFYEFNFEISTELSEFSDINFIEGLYKKNFEELKFLGEGSYGTVFKVRMFGRKIPSAMKKIKFDAKYESEVLREMQFFSVANKLSEKYIV